ncbi:MAG: 5-histidylcysteine sulfoxide synthase [Gammaproteobacteria bacterium]|nr:5-histidylcysteine sulfoxide synthase [Gammaproteobacteria bacterium]
MSSLTHPNQYHLTRADLVTAMPQLTQGDVETKRAEIKHYFNLTFSTYETLFETLADNSAFYLRPCSLRHPLIFYFGHTATFFTNKLVLAKLLDQRINPPIESMCAIGVDEMSWDDLNDAHYDWPSVEAVRAYRQQVRDAVNRLIDTLNFSLPINWQSPMWPILMGIEHERIHLETSSVLIRQLPLDKVRSHPLFPICPDHGDAPKNSLLPVSGGEIQLNHQDPADTYGWDNEYGRHDTVVADFKAAKFLVSNQEYLAFVEAGGYENADYWSEEGNRWRQFTPDKHPTFWVKKAADNGQSPWWLRCMTEEIPMPWNWPVEVNFLEADAFCRWKSQQAKLPIRLPSEDEYLRLREVSGATQSENINTNANHNLQFYASSMPVDRFNHGGFYDVIGNVWQWTQTPIYPFEGFKVHPLYDDFTMPTFDNKHNIFKGGCWISTGNEINGHSRYAFRRHFFQHAGFRYIESAAPVQTEYPTFETDTTAAQHCEFHYGDHYFGVPNFPQAMMQRVVKELQQDADLKNRQDLKALEIGCLVGRGCFELAPHVAEVTGLDFSARFINVAEQLKQNGAIRYSIVQEGEIMDFKQRDLADNLKAHAHKCTFLQQDPANLKPIFSGYDLIVAANVIEQLYDPAAFLSALHSRLNPGGLLVIASTYHWQESVTEKTRWLGGYKDEQTGENVASLEGLTNILSAHFEPAGAPQDIPLVIRHSARDYAHKLSQITVWKKRR